MQSTSQKQNHQAGHRERLRKRFSAAPDLVSDYEILELLLGYVITRQDTKPLAKDLLQKFGSINGVFTARPEELKNVLGIGPKVVLFFNLLHEFFSRRAEEPARQREVLCSPEIVAQMSKQRLGHLSEEEVWCAFVDSGNRLISWEKMSQGNINSSVIAPRDILEKGLALKARGFILVHNHPGGNVCPSQADIDITKRIEQAARIVGLRLLDHIIVTDTNSFSMIDNSML